MSYAMLCAQLLDLLMSYAMLCTQLLDLLMAYATLCTQLLDLSTWVQVQSQVSPCGICGGQSDTKTGLSPGNSIFTSSITPPMLHTHPVIYHCYFQVLKFCHNFKECISYHRVHTLGTKLTELVWLFLLTCSCHDGHYFTAMHFK